MCCLAGQPPGPLCGLTSGTPEGDLVVFWWCLTSPTPLVGDVGGCLGFLCLGDVVVEDWSDSARLRSFLSFFPTSGPDSAGRLRFGMCGYCLGSLRNAGMALGVVGGFFVN